MSTNSTNDKFISFYDKLLLIKNTTHKLNFDNSKLLNNVENLDHKDDINEFYTNFIEIQKDVNDLQILLKDLIASEKLNINLNNQSFFKKGSKMKNKPHYLK